MLNDSVGADGKAVFTLSPIDQDIKAKAGFRKYIDCGDKGLLDEAFGLDTIRLGTVIAKAQCIVKLALSTEGLTSSQAITWALSLAQDVADLEGEPVLGDQIPAIEDENERRAACRYLAWLTMERRLLAHQLWPNIRDAEAYCPSHAGAESFHFPADRPWNEVPMPSTRAEKIFFYAMEHMLDLTERNDAQAVAK